MNNFVYLESSDIDLIKGHLYFSLFGDVSTATKNFLQNTQKFERVKPTNYFDLEQNLQDDNLFDLGDGNKSIYLVDLEDWELSKNDIEEISSLAQNSQKQVCFFTSGEMELPANTKKLWKKNLKLETLKSIDAKIAECILDLQIVKLDLKLNKSQKQQLLSECISYRQIINTLDMIKMSENPSKALSLIQSPEAVQLFRLPFSTSNLSSDTKKWFDSVSDGEIQLAITLLHTKLEKQNNPTAKKIIKSLIQTDNKIKTRSKISPTIHFKYMLWLAKKI